MRHDPSATAAVFADRSFTQSPHAFGAWLFRQRSWIPAPFAILLVATRWHAMDLGWLRIVGALLVMSGQALRLWSVRHIGVISRTRAARLGPLVSTGPYRLTRNPLYIANASLWLGFVAWSELLWLLPIASVLFVLQYSLMTRWEEQQLCARFGDSYDAYRRMTPRWLPNMITGAWARAWREPARHVWSDVLFSERGTIIAVTALAFLLWLKWG